MNFSKSLTAKILIAIFIVFMTFRPKQSEEVYKQMMYRLNEVNSLSSDNIKDRVMSSLSKANTVLNKHEEELKPTAKPEPISECKCRGTGQITHGDGHKTPCTCEKPCKCEKPKSLFGDEEKQDLEKFIEKAVQKSFDNYVENYAKRAEASKSQKTTNQTVIQSTPQQSGQTQQ